MFKIYDGRNEFYQWDLDQKLIVSDPTINEVHFCNLTGDCALVCKVYGGESQRLVNVPNILLQKTFSIRAYAHCDCATKASQTFNVIPRSKPTDYVYTEKEKYTLEALINEALKDGITLSSSAIIDVDELPTEDINTSLLYRTHEGVYWYDGEWHKVADEGDIHKSIGDISCEIEENILPHIVNADYDENDTESKAHILNRPFYDTRVTDENGEETGELKTLEDKYLDLENRAKMQEVESIAKGANQAVSFGDYASMVSVFNNLPKDAYRVGQNVYIVELGVPDLWISEIKDTPLIYDAELEGGYNAFQSYLEANGTYQVGYYVLSRLETQKVELTNYVTFTDEPGNTTAGGKPGVVGLNYATSCGLRYVGNAGKRYLTVYEGNSTDVLRRNGACVITLATMDARIKAVITGERELNKNGSWVKSYGNQPTLTDIEKSSAKAWLGVPTTYKKTFGVKIPLDSGDEFIGTYVEYSTNDSLDTIAGKSFNALYLAEVLNTQPSRLAIINTDALTIRAVDGALINPLGMDSAELVICYRDADGKSASYNINFNTLTEDNLIRTVEEI